MNYGAWRTVRANTKRVFSFMIKDKKEKQPKHGENVSRHCGMKENVVVTRVATNPDKRIAELKKMVANGE